jgi:hypothetical protein
MLTLGYSKEYSSLYQQNLTNVLWPLKDKVEFNDSLLQEHINIPVHLPKVSSTNINNQIVFHQVNNGLNSDVVQNGLWMSDFNPQTLTIDTLGYGLLEGAGHHYFTNTRVSLLLMDSTLPYERSRQGRRVWYSTNHNVTINLGDPIGNISSDDRVKIHSPVIINNTDEDIKPYTGDTHGLTQIEPWVFEGSVLSLDTDNPFFNFPLTSSTVKTGQFQLDPDVLPLDGFINETDITNNPVVQSMQTHVNDSSIHPGSWGLPELLDSQTVSGRVISDLYDDSTIRSTPHTGDWFVTPGGGSMSYKEGLTDPVAHWLAISIGNPNALVTDPDDSDIVLGECVNGTDQMRCYFTLADGKLPVATPGVILRRCNPIMGFTAKTLADYGGS